MDVGPNVYNETHAFLWVPFRLKIYSAYICSFELCYYTRDHYSKMRGQSLLIYKHKKDCMQSYFNYSKLLIPNGRKNTMLGP